MAKKGRKGVSDSNKGKKGVSDTKNNTTQDNSKYFDMLKDYTGGSYASDVYWRLDLNKTGTLGRGDLYQAIHGIKNMKGFSAKEFEKIWSDIVHRLAIDGQIDFNEFLGVFQKS